MITHAVSAAIVPPRSAWRSLLWTAPFTVLWTSLNYSLPMLLESGLPALAVRLMVHGLVALGLWLGLERTDLTPGQRRTTWLAITSWPRVNTALMELAPSGMSRSRSGQMMVRVALPVPSLPAAPPGPPHPARVIADRKIATAEKQILTG